MPLSPGTQVAGYRVISLLGSGGMGEVYLVENPNLLRREALKVISLAGAHDPDFQRRFTNEARTTAALDHPSIISIYQYGINDDGAPWFTMNYLEGTDLASGPIPARDVVEVARRVSDALDYAHRHQIVHRDIKPANIIVSRDAGSGEIDRVTVLDFGIAKLVNSTSLTATSAFIGTLAYCAPEVIEGHDATAPSDQYSLACTIFQLLTGQAPFTTTTPSALVMAHLTKPIPPISSLRPDLAALDPVLHKALAKSPHDRYPDCRSFAAALRQALDGTAAHLGGPPGAGQPGYPPIPLERPSSTPTPPPSQPNSHPQPGARPVSHPTLGQPYPHASYTPQSATEQRFAQPNHFVQQPYPSNTPVPTAMPGAGGPPLYPPAGAPHLLGGGQPPLRPPKKKRTGLIITAIAASVVLVAVAAVGISWAAGVFDGSQTPPTATSAAQTLSSYGNTSCGVVAKTGYCWGANYDGQLGDGSSTAKFTPTKLTLTDVSAISIGGYVDSDGNYETSTCSVAGKKAYCWGSNSRGQLGTAGTADTTNPAAIGQLNDVTAITTGQGTSCAISSGDVYCWGDNSESQIGVDSVGDRASAPTKVAGIDGTATSVSTTQGTTCAVADASVYCWGNNDNGQIGSGLTGRQRTPKKLDLTDVTSVYIGTYRYHSNQFATTCATTRDKAYCWGDNSYGQIGDNTKTQHLTPTPVSTINGATSISTGWGASCAVVNSRVLCWGSNTEKQLGTGASSGDSSTPVPVAGIAGTVTAAVTGTGTTCVALEDRDIYCWGQNLAGQVGNGNSGKDATVTTPYKLTLPT